MATGINVPQTNQDQHTRYVQSVAESRARNAYRYADISPLPEVVKPRRKAGCRRNLQRFLKTYFPDTSGLWPFSSDHKRMVSRIQQCILHGGNFANVVYRGFGKTTISANAALWAILFGHARFAVVLANEAQAAHNILDDIRGELETNDLLLEDFPEVCWSVRALDGISIRGRTQHLDGERTRIDWAGDLIKFPIIKGSPCSGSVLTCRGITGALRGMSTRNPADGSRMRPDLVIGDDLQTDESAKSELQINTRLNILKKTVLQLSGHGHSMACVVNATIIEQFDVAHQLVDKELNPSWQAECVPMVRKWSDQHESMWLTTYAELRRNFDPEDTQAQQAAHKMANSYYRANRRKMDAGCEVSWKHCYDRDTELSAIQHAYNILIDDGEDVFAAEYQNAPTPKSNVSDICTAKEILLKTTSVKRNEVPVQTTKLTAAIDIQQRCLFWKVCAWEDHFSGRVVNYGVFPEQSRGYFSASAASRTLEKRYPGHGFEAYLRAGLDELTGAILDYEFERDDGSVQQVERLLIDANWGDSTDVVYQMVREHPKSQLITPAHGKFYGASSEPISTRRSKKKQGEIIGLEWFMPVVTGRKIRHLIFDSNFWKSFIHKRLATPLGDRGCLSLFHSLNSGTHRLLADHLTAEYPVKTFGRGREVVEWKWKPNKPDNHWLDTMVMCAVGASMQGVKVQGEEVVGQRKRKKISVKQMQGMR